MVQQVKYQPDDRAASAGSKLQRQWASGAFVITAQLPPLLTTQSGTFVEQIAAGSDWFDAVLAVDAPGGVIALSGMAMAVLLRRAGIEAIVQMSGRDRNRLALQSDMLSLSVCGIPNLLIDTRPIARASLRQNADARLVADLDGPALLAVAAQLRDEARFTSGASIKVPPLFYLGALVSLEKPPLSEELSAAQFLVTTLVQDVRHQADALNSFLTDYNDFLKTRPLLVSLPLSTGVQEEKLVDRDAAFEACTQATIAAIEVLEQCNGVRGCNIVVERYADLALLEHVTHTFKSHYETLER